MRGTRTALLLRLLAPALAAACAGAPDRHTLGELRAVEPDMTEVRVEHGLDQAMQGYRKFLEEAPESALTPEAMRRLADLKLEKQYGILGDAEIVELPAPEAGTAPGDAEPGARDRERAAGAPAKTESDAAFERRAAGEAALSKTGASASAPLPGGAQVAPSGPLEAIALYDQILTAYPTYPFNDQVLYQKSRAYDELGRVDEAIAVMERLVKDYPHSRHIDEVQFRRAEYFFTRKRYLDAEDAYSAITRMGATSDYYELALYKLGWTFYKQDLHEEALHEYIALLDYKVSTGYDFDQKQDEENERRIADTYRVISLSFSSLGGTEIVAQYFADNGSRTYEDRIYAQLGEFYLEKLRYHDAATAYQAFIEIHPLHRSAPQFGMRVVDIYEAGGFPKLVLESKKDFAARYGLQSEYWRHSKIEESPEVLAYLKTNLQDLASHYHALFQQPDLADDRPANFDEALRWYRAYLASFPTDPGAPATHYRLADLLLEDRDFDQAAREYERTAYDYPEHERAAAAGYAAIYAHREHQKQADAGQQDAARREAVASTLRFVDTFPRHEHAAAVLGAAVDDLYGMKDFERAIATGHRLIDGYPEADPSIRRSAWLAVAHSSFDTASYPQAEQAYARVLEMTAPDDDTRQGVVDNLAASIYKQGEQASAAADHRAAADHFLRIAQAAPSSGIRPLAEYDAGAALVRLEDWSGAAAVFDSFRETHPEHELAREATRQMAFVYRQQGDQALAAGEYERVAAEAEDGEARREALLVAAELYEGANVTDKALAVYLDYVSQFPEPIETAVETRFKLASMYQAAGDEAKYHDQLRQIVAIDEAGDERTPRIRYLAARSALVLTEGLYQAFAEVELLQPFEQSLQEKQRRMKEALDAFGSLVDYEVGEVTAAATFYMAEIYSSFSRALVDSERPTDLDAAGMQDYELALEEEAFPFEEQAIEVHEKNVELMVASGIWNPWIEKSLGRLALLMPGRYAKLEASAGFITAIDQYAYLAPTAPVAAAETSIGEAAPEAPAAAAELEAAPASAPAPAPADAADEAVQ